MNLLLKYLLIIFFGSYTVQSYSQIDFLYDKVSEQPTEIPPYSEFLEFEPLNTSTSYYNPIDISKLNFTESGLKNKPKEQSIEDIIKQTGLEAEAAVLKDRLENSYIPTGMTTFADVNKYDDLNIPDIIGVDQEPLYNQVKSNTSITTSPYNNQDEETYKSSSYSDNNTTGETPYDKYFFLGFLILVVFTLGAVFGKRV